LTFPALKLVQRIGAHDFAPKSKNPLPEAAGSMIATELAL
jgi:hypothetical protein